MGETDYLLSYIDYCQSNNESSYDRMIRITIIIFHLLAPILGCPQQDTTRKNLGKPIGRKRTTSDSFDGIAGIVPLLLSL